MKRLIYTVSLLLSLQGVAQDASHYDSLLANTDEVSLSDSLHINTIYDERNRLDSADVKQWFFPLLGSVNNNRLKNRAYFLNGKITGNPNFNLLLIMEEKKKNDTINSQVVYIITTRKDGTYIASLKAAIAGIKKKSSYNTSSWLYSDYKVVLDSKMVINERPYYDLANYKINRTGRFILYPNY